MIKLIKMYGILFLLLLSQSPEIYSQNNLQIQWARAYSGDDSSVVPKALKLDNIGNIYVSGYIVKDTTSADFITIKYDSNGLELWKRQYNGSSNSTDVAYLITTDNMNNVYVCGISNDISNRNNITTLKYNSEGILQWLKKYYSPGNNIFIFGAKQICVDNYCNIYVLGQSINMTTIGFDYVLIKYDSNGNEEWSLEYDDFEGSWDHPEDMGLDPFGNIFITGTTRNSALTMKYDPDGNLLWKIYYKENNSMCFSRNLVIDELGNVYVAGKVTNRFFTSKYNSDGIEQWVKKYNLTGNGDIYVTDLNKDSDNIMYLTGFSKFVGPGNKIITIKYNSEGSELWVAHYNRSSEFPTKVQLNDKREIYIAGEITGDSTRRDYFILKFDSLGNKFWTYQYNIYSDFEDQIVDFVIDDSDNIYVVGITGKLDWWKENWIWSIITTIKYSEISSNLFLNQFPNLISNFSLNQNYPNPFNLSTIIEFSIPFNSNVQLRIFDISGNEVINLINKIYDPGNYKITWDAGDFPSGIYLFQLKTNTFVETKKLLLTK